MLELWKGIDMIHTFGDSHCLTGWNKIPVVVTHHIGAVLCYSFGKERLMRLDIKKFGVQEGDVVIFSMGEIDCRCHIFKHVSEECSFEIIISRLVAGYFEAIKENVSRFSGLKVVVYNIPPATRKGITYENPDYPYAGSDSDRKEYVQCFNKLLRKCCLEYGYTFFDIYSAVVDREGFLAREYSDGNVHIIECGVIEPKLWELGLL
jgi:hypothetical protein